MHTTKNSKISKKPDEPHYKKRYPNLYRSRYYAMLYVFGWSLTLSLIWGFSRWIWVTSLHVFETDGTIPHVVVPLSLTAVQLLLCRHFIRGIHNSIEWAVWIVLPVISFLLYFSVGVYVEVRNSLCIDFEMSHQLAMLWQTILMFEALALFLIYQHYYVIEEYEDSAQKTIRPVFKPYIFARILVLYIVPAIMVLMFIAMKSDAMRSGQNVNWSLIRWGSLFFPYVLAEGEWWRLISYAFQHGSLVHLVSNMICYWWCMQVLLKRYNGYQLLGVFLLASFFSGVSILVFSEQNTVGASGGVFGLMAFWAIDSFYTLKSIEKKKERASVVDRRKLELEQIDVRTECSSVISMLAYNVVHSFAAAISTSGHFGGLVAGVAVWFLFNIWPILTWIIASLSVVLIVFCLYNCRVTLMQIHSDNFKAKMLQRSKSRNVSSSSEVKRQNTKKWNVQNFRGMKDGKWYLVMIGINTKYLDIPGLQRLVSQKLFNNDSDNLQETVQEYVKSFSHVDYQYTGYDYPYIQISLSEPHFYTSESIAHVFADRVVVNGKNDYDYQCSYEIKIDTKAKKIVE